MVNQTHDIDQSSPVRPKVTKTPDVPLSMPYEIRPECEWIDFSSLTNPLGTPPRLIKALIDSLKKGDLSCLPDREDHVLRSYLARKFNLDVSCFLCGSGVSQMVNAVAQTYRPCVVGVSVPCPAEIPLAISNAGHRIANILGVNGFMSPDPSLVNLDGYSIDAAILSNPSFPASRLLPKSILMRYIQACKWVIVDESSIDLTLSGESFVPLTAQYKNLIIIRSLTYTYAIPGAPISYIIASPDTIKQIEQFYDSSFHTMFSEVLSDSFEKLGTYLDESQQFIDKEIPWLQYMLNLMPGVRVFPAEANYIMCEYQPIQGGYSTLQDAEELCAKALNKGINLGKIHQIPGLEDNRYFYVSVKSHEENVHLVNALREVLSL